MNVTSSRSPNSFQFPRCSDLSSVHLHFPTQNLFFRWVGPRMNASDTQQQEQNKAMILLLLCSGYGLEFPFVILLSVLKSPRRPGPAIKSQRLCSDHRRIRFVSQIRPLRQTVLIFIYRRSVQIYVPGRLKPFWVASA